MKCRVPQSHSYSQQLLDTQWNKCHNYYYDRTITRWRWLSQCHASPKALNVYNTYSWLTLYLWRYLELVLPAGLSRRCTCACMQPADYMLIGHEQCTIIRSREMCFQAYSVSYIIYGFIAGGKHCHWKAMLENSPVWRNRNSVWAHLRKISLLLQQWGGLKKMYNFMWSHFGCSCEHNYVLNNYALPEKLNLKNTYIGQEQTASL